MQQGEAAAREGGATPGVEGSGDAAVSNFAHRLRRWSALREECGAKLQEMVNVFGLLR